MLETSTLQNNGKSLLYQPNALGCDPQPDWAQNREFEQDAFAPEKPRHSIEQPLRGPDGKSLVRIYFWFLTNYNIRLFKAYGSSAVLR